MGGSFFAVGRCAACGGPFGFNPDRVPSVVVRGVREPLCRPCVEAANPQRVARGVAPITVLPGAYEPAAEGDEGPAGSR